MLKPTETAAPFRNLLTLISRFLISSKLALTVRCYYLTHISISVKPRQSHGLFWPLRNTAGTQKMVRQNRRKRAGSWVCLDTDPLENRPGNPQSSWSNKHCRTVALIPGRFHSWRVVDRPCDACCSGTKTDRRLQTIMFKSPAAPPAAQRWLTPPTQQKIWPQRIRTKPQAKMLATDEWKTLEAQLHPTLPSLISDLSKNRSGRALSTRFNSSQADIWGQGRKNQLKKRKTTHTNPKAKLYTAG